MPIACKRNGKIAGSIGISIILLAGLAAIAHAGWLDDIFGRNAADTARAAGIVETSDAVKIPLKALDSGKALFLRQELEGRQIHYFAMKSSDGAYRAAFDACDVCYRANRGYRQKGDSMVCSNCGQTFPSARIGEVKGGCNPHPLARKVEGQYLVIRKTDIAAGKDYFLQKRA